MKTTAKFKHEGKTYQATVRDRGDGRCAARCRLYVFPSKSVFADLADRFTGARYDRERRATEKDMAVAAMHALGFTSGLSYSRRAGCPCGCSPGFILGNTTLHGLEIFVKVV
jgi:hypothetical protein